jgi:ribosome recycling factor
MSEVTDIYEDCEADMMKAVEHLESELTKIRAGRATPSMLSSVSVDYYGSTTPLSQVANISTPDARTLQVQPWEKSMIDPIEKAIIASNLGLNPSNNGEVVLINVPMLTEERRKDLSKNAHREGENAKISFRNARHKAIDQVKALQKEGLAEDNAKDAEDEIQNITNRYNKRADELVAAKEKDIMTV